MSTPYPTGERVLEALGTATRRQILALLSPGPRAVGEIAAVLPITRPAVSKQLRVLEDASLVVFSIDGSRRVYRLCERGFDVARRYLDGFWDEALTRFQTLVDIESDGDAQ
ncbi:MAG: DNA-binding transcriptional ArsR family regulator [Myxococcota bacterium]|jgi:DNA-binding transcriptional ArsR family regulator